MAVLQTWRIAMLVGPSLLMARSAAAQAQPPGAPGTGGASVDLPAPAPVPVPSRADHPDGFFVDANLGVGELWINGGGYSTWGRTVPFELSGGPAIAPSLAVFAALHDAAIVLPVSDASKVDRLDLYGAGPGLKYQLTRPNIFIAGSASISRLHIDRAAQPDDTSHWGVLGRVSAGRQWRASPW